MTRLNHESTSKTTHSSLENRFRKSQDICINFNGFYIYIDLDPPKESIRKSPCKDLMKALKQGGQLEKCCPFFFKNQKKQWIFTEKQKMTSDSDEQKNCKYQIQLCFLIVYILIIHLSRFAKSLCHFAPW